MLRNKAIIILKTFSKEEIKNFRLYLLSPFFNKNKKIVLLYNILVKYFYPDFDSEKLTNEFLMNKTGTKSLSRLRELISYLHELCNDYFSYLRMSSQKYEKERFLMHELEYRGEKKLYWNNIIEFEKKIDKTKNHGSVDFYYKFLIYKSKGNFLSLHREPKNPESIKTIAKINDISNNYLNCFCLLNNVVSLNDFLYRSKKVKLNIEEFNSINLFDLINKKIGDVNIWKMLKVSLTNKEKILLELYYYKYLLKKFADIKIINEAIIFLKKHFSEIDICARYSMFAELLNQVYAISNCNKDMESYEFKFYDFFLKNKGYEIENEKYMSFQLFRFFLMRGFSSKNTNWIKRFFDNYINTIYPEYRLQMENYFYSYYYFMINRFDSSLDFCGKVNFDFYAFKRDIKQLYIMIFYELKEMDSVVYSCENLRKFIVNNKFTEEGSSPFLKFIRFTKKLVDLNENNCEYEILKLKDKIETSGITASKYWLIEKVKLLINSQDNKYQLTKKLLA